MRYMMVRSGPAAFTAPPAQFLGTDEWQYWAPDDNPFVPDGDGLTGGTLDATAATTRTTYHSCSIRWKPATGGPAVTCEVNYRVDGESTWHVGHDLFWDDFPRNLNQPPEMYKGSLLHLKPGTLYDYRVKITDGPSAGQYYDGQFTTRTDPANLTITSTTLLPATQAAPYTIDTGDSGTGGGYHLITFDPANGGTVIDAANTARYCIDIQGTQDVIIRGLTLTGAANVGIFLRDGVNNVIIDECDISDWGSAGVGGYGQTRDGAIGNEDRDLNLRFPDVTNVTIQRCLIHDPRWDTNAWDQPETTHPQGPSVVWFATTNGGHVFRYNHSYGDGNGTKRYNDGYTGGFNDTDAGFPGPDSDIYGNIIRECWDDGVEIDGGGDMIRLWGNYIDQTFNPVSISPNHKGIVYVFRNVCDRTQREEDQPVDGSNGGTFIKMQSFIAANRFGFGRNMVFNNTLLQSGGVAFGCREGISPLGVTSRAPRQAWVRNNILDVVDLQSIDIPGDAGNAYENDVDYDLNSGTVIAYTGAEANAVNGAPTYKTTGDGSPPYSPTAPTGNYELDPSSAGYGAGQFLKGLTLNVTAATPDIGAHEKGRVVMQFGPGAYL